MAIINLTSENFEQEVINSDQTVLIDFYANWCGPCRILLPVIEEIAEEVQDKKICKVNVDEQPGLAQRFSVTTIPTLIVMKNGKAVSTSVGVKPKNAVLEMLNV